MVHQNVFCCKPVSWKHKLVEMFHLCSVMFQNRQKEGEFFFKSHTYYSCEYFSRSANLWEWSNNGTHDLGESKQNFQTGKEK
jgi:hypothetical protein